ncbi:MAG: MATE family efflux transporter [Lachnospiraceae bacterium]|nr:MATE family efflux transporter [Lachnospiraceae bacterium]
MAKDLTKGRITPLLIKFTVPLVLGNLLQITYNAADSIIVGRAVGKEALAAVGTCNPVMTLMILFLNGLCIGAAVLMGTQYGAGDYDTLKRQVSTTLLAGLVFTVVLSVLCIVFAGPILKLLQVDPDWYDIALEYMQIIFLGLVFTYLYNFFSATLRALGDSIAPLLFLMISAGVNIAGDLFFVLVLDWGSRGCAIATVLSEALSAAFCVLYIHLRVPLLDLGRKWLVFDRSLLAQTIRFGWASAMQQGTVQLGKIATQGIVNTMGVNIAAAYAIVNRLDDFAVLTEQNIAHALTAFMAQNRGAGRTERVRGGFFAGLRLEVIYGAIVSVLAFALAAPLVSAFTKDPDVLREGVTYLRLMALFYLMPAVTNGVQGYFRGIGQMRVTLLSSIVNMGMRVASAALFVLVLRMGMHAVPLSYVVGWAFMLLVEAPIFMKNLHHLKAGPAPAERTPDESHPAQ